MSHIGSTINATLAAGRKLPRGTLRWAVPAVAAMLLVSPGHVARAEPTRTIKIVVPLPAGGGADIMTRVLAEQIGRVHPVAIVVENRPGAGMMVGTDVASRAAADGNTLLITQPPFLINSHLRKLSYDPLTSFEPVCHLASSPNVIVVNAASPYRKLADLLDAARATPGVLTLASVSATTSHIAFEMLKREANVDMTFVPYPGAIPAVNALLGGHVTAVSVPYPNVAEHLRAGTLRALATPSAGRIEPLPDVPTVAESGYQNVEAGGWTGLVAPAKTPKDTLVELAGWFTAAMQIPEVRTRLSVLGLYPVGTCGADFAAFLRKQSEDFGNVLRAANIKVE